MSLIDYASIIKKAEERTSLLQRIMELVESGAPVHATQLGAFERWLNDVQNEFKRLDKEGKELLPLEIAHFLGRPLEQYMIHIMGSVEMQIPGLESINKLICANTWVPEPDATPPKPKEEKPLVPKHTKTTPNGVLSIKFMEGWDTFNYPDGCWVANHPGMAGVGEGLTPTEAFEALERLAKHRAE